MKVMSRSHHDLTGWMASGAERTRRGRELSGIERAEVHISSGGFSPHRHDTYAIGLTLSGVQTFQYRGSLRHCLPGQCHVLHPDELHDGRAVNGGEFSYRMIYVAPAALQAALDGAHLPHVTDPIVPLRPETSELLFRLWNIHDDLIDVEDDEMILSILGFLQTLSDDASIISRRAIPWKALSRVREQLDERSTIRCTAKQLEEISGLDRWTLAREFRAAYGTSPRSFRTMRQLEKVRGLLLKDASAADAAAVAGFSDQSHMSRMFKRTYGFTPMQWLDAVRHDKCRFDAGTRGRPSSTRHRTLL
jgi:AraC-like DNA-binding protein